MTQSNLPSPESSPDNQIWQRWATARWWQQQQLTLLTRWQMLHQIRGRGPRWRRARRRLQQTAVALLLGGALLFSPRQPAHAAGAAFTEQTGAANPFDGVGMVHDNPTFADIDNDGDPDAFLPGYEGETAVIRHFRNEGTPFAPLFVQQHNADNPFAGLSIDLLSSHLTFADLDNDGDLDAFMGDMNGLIVHYQNVGTPLAPVFAAPTYLPAAEGGNLDTGDSSAPFFVDIDGDGDLDLFVGEKGGSIRYYQNTGSAAAPLFPDSPLTNPFGLIDIGAYSRPTFADLDSDGDLDALTGAEDGALHYFQNSGTATAPAFAAPVINPFGLAGVGANSSATLTDIDGDGDLDAFIGSNSSMISGYSRNTGSAAAPAFTAQAGADHPINLAQDQSQPVLADIDQDGDLDAFVGVANGTIHYYWNNGTPLAATFSPQSGADNPLAGVQANTAVAMAFADLDGDGDLDAFVRATDGIHYYRNSGTPLAPVFGDDAAANPFNGLDMSAATSLTFTDIDGDGDLDAFGGTAEGTIRYYPNIGSATQPAFADGSAANPLAGVDVGEASAPTFADLDGDGDLDAIIGAADGLFHTYQNTGTPIAPVFNAQTGDANPLNGLDAGEASAPALVDIDGDGDIDVFSGAGDGRLHHYRNTGANTFTATFIPRSGVANPFNGVDVGTNASPTFVDIDGDGDMDAFIGAYTGIRSYQNTGTALVPVFTEQTGAANLFDGVDVGIWTAPIFVDVDGDGDMDAFIGSKLDGIFYYENTGTALTPAFTERTGVDNPLSGMEGLITIRLSFVDMDADGDMDAFIGERGRRILYYQNTGTVLAPLFVAQTGAANPFNGVDTGGGSAINFVDVDGDGDMDAFIGISYGTILYYQNTGTALAPLFTAQTGAANPFNGVDVGGGSIPTFVDVDGDGDMDTIIGENNSGVIFYYENTHCSFTSEASGPLTAGSVFHFGNGNSRLTVQVNNVGEPPLTGISVACNAGNHPNATANMTVGAYWSITPNAGAGSTTPFDLNLTMPFKNPAAGEDKLCRYTGGPGYGWECDQDTLTATTITQNNVTALSDWTVGDDVGPTAVSLSSFSAVRQVGWVGWLVGVMGGVATAVLLLLRPRKRKPSSNKKQ